MTKARPNTEIQLFKDASFALGRVHEICGPARLLMAVHLAAKAQGPVLWIRPKWTTDRLLPTGLAGILDPSRLLYLDAPKQEDILWSMEETLRSGAIPTVIAELNTPPALTPVRRLLLAVESGRRKGQKPPLSLLLTPDQGGAQGVETRWHAASILGGSKPKWQLTRSRARMAPPTKWQVQGENFQPCP